MGKYSKCGLYGAYDKNHKERQAEDYYATSTEEVLNILNILDLPIWNEDIILELSCGGGHMVDGILKYLDEHGLIDTSIYATDIKDRGYTNDDERIFLRYGDEMDVLRDDYGSEFPVIDYVIMNPPFSLIEPFTIRMLEIAKKGVLMFGRIQFLEGKGRYENILKDNPPSDVYVYVDRVKCYKNGDFSNQGDRIQAYCWYYWNIENPKDNPVIHWIHRVS